MQLDDRLRIETPEGVSLELTLAGLGSRFGAAAVDLIIQGVVLLLVVLALSLAGSVMPGDFGVFLMGIGTLVVAVVVIGYYVLFEALNGGRTPGKAAFGLRVASLDGTSLSLSAVTLRTLMRLVDFLPVGYAVGAGAILATDRNQRLGDLVAATVVVRDRLARPTPEAGTGAAALGWDTTGVTPGEIDLIRRFVERRPTLEAPARKKIATDLATRLRPRVRGGDELSDEAFLSQLLDERQAR